MMKPFIATLLLLLLAAPGRAVAQAPAAPLTDAQMEQFLQTARVARSRGTEKGVTGSLRATLTDGKFTHDAHIQTIDEFKQEFKGGERTEFNFRDSWRFNVAAYRIDRLLGLRLVPVSVDRTWRGQGAAFTWWIDDVLMDEEERLQKKLQPPDALCWSEQLRHLRMFDQLIDNVDRNVGNFIISNSWRLWGIDSTRAFRYSRTPRNPERLVRIDRALLERLKTLDFVTLKREVGRYLNDADIRAILSRRDGIVAHFAKLGEGGLYNRGDPAAGCQVPALRHDRYGRNSHGITPRIPVIADRRATSRRSQRPVVRRGARLAPSDAAQSNTPTRPPPTSSSGRTKRGSEGCTS